MATHQDRRQALQHLIECRGQLREAIDRVRQFPWDCDEELVVMTMSDVLAVLSRYRSGELTAKQVEDWADALEVRDDIAYDSDEVVDALFRFSSPEINGAITPSSVREFIARYDSAV